MPYCPRCRTEYESRITLCSDCGIPLTPELPPEDFGKDPVVVLRASTAHEAQIAAATLRAEGIPAYTASPDVYLPQLGNPVATVTPEFLVWVPAEAHDRALVVLSEPPPTDAELMEAEQAADPEPEIDEPIEP